MSVRKSNNIYALTVVLFATWTALGESLQEPIQDHLSDMDSGRLELAGDLDLKSLINVRTFELDIDGNGSNELFVGHNRMWTGDTKGMYWTVYERKDDEFVRISPKSKDLRITFGGEGGWFYAGMIEEMGKNGLLVVPGPIKEEPLYFAEAKFYYLEGGNLFLKQLGPIDLSSDLGEKMYKKYAESPSTETRQPTRELGLSSEQLAKTGYDLSTWENSSSVANHAVQNESLDRSKIESGNQSKPSTVQETTAEAEQQPASFLWIWIGAILVFAGVVAFLVFKRQRT